MKNIKKSLFSIFIISFFNMLLIEKSVYANPIADPDEIEVISYSPLYYITIIFLIDVVVGISILILKNIYKSNQLEKNEEDKKGDKESW